MIVKKLKKLDKIQITGNPKLFKKNFISEYNLKKCVMFSYSELSYKQKAENLVREGLMLMTQPESMSLAIEKFEQAARLGNIRAKQTVKAYQGESADNRVMYESDLPSLGL